MKIARMFTAAAIVAASLGVSGAANAQNYGGDRHSYQDNRGDQQSRRDNGDEHARRDNGEHDRGNWNADNRDNRRSYNDRGRGYSHNDRDRGYGWGRHHNRCHTEWRYHHRVTICR